MYYLLRFYEFSVINNNVTVVAHEEYNLKCNYAHPFIYSDNSLDNLLLKFNLKLLNRQVYWTIL